MINEYNLKWLQFKTYLNMTNQGYYVDLRDSYAVWVLLGGQVIKCVLDKRNTILVEEFETIYRSKCNLSLKASLQHISRMITTNSEISLNKNVKTEVVSINSDKGGEIEFLSISISTSSFNIIIEIDGEEYTNLDFSVLKDVLKFKRDTSYTPFTIEANGSEYVFSYNPNSPLSFSNTFKVFINSYKTSNKKFNFGVITYGEIV